jgi:hypothetical protein
MVEAHMQRRFAVTPSHLRSLGHSPVKMLVVPLQQLVLAGMSSFLIRFFAECVVQSAQ